MSETKKQQGEEHACNSHSLNGDCLSFDRSPFPESGTSIYSFNAISGTSYTVYKTQINKTGTFHRAYISFC